jgi:hypothetical protein
LYSDVDNSDAAKGGWNKLVRKGLVEKISESPDRWKLI